MLLEADLPWRPGVRPDRSSGFCEQEVAEPVRAPGLPLKDQIAGRCTLDRTRIAHTRRIRPDPFKRTSSLSTSWNSG